MGALLGLRKSFRAAGQNSDTNPKRRPQSQGVVNRGNQTTVQATMSVLYRGQEPAVKCPSQLSQASWDGEVADQRVLSAVAHMYCLQFWWPAPPFRDLNDYRQGPTNTACVGGEDAESAAKAPFQKCLQAHSRLGFTLFYSSKKQWWSSAYSQSQTPQLLSKGTSMQNVSLKNSNVVHQCRRVVHIPQRMHISTS